MPSLVQRCKEIVSAESDDFFGSDTVLFYINKSAARVINYMVQQELRPTIQVGDEISKGVNRSLRSLDILRTVDTSTLATADFADQGSYYTGFVALPTDLLQVLTARYNETTPLREVNSQKLHLLNYGNLEPTAYESYYYVTDDSGTNSIELYLYEDPDGNDLEVFYIKAPTEITDATTESFTDVPDQLENAVLYGAAYHMLTQESVKDPNANVNLLMSIYQQELQNAKF